MTLNRLTSWVLESANFGYPLGVGYSTFGYPLGVRNSTFDIQLRPLPRPSSLESVEFLRDWVREI